MMIPQVTEGVKDLGKFQSIVKLTAFSPFKSGVNALENINAISEGIVHEDLKNFLEVSSGDDEMITHVWFLTPDPFPILPNICCVVSIQFNSISNADQPAREIERWNRFTSRSRRFQDQRRY